jgi:hypothetical protein
VKAAFAGIPLNNEIWPYFDEYLTRKRMCKLGFTTDFDDLDDKKAQIFMQISAEIDNHEQSEMKKNGKR